jgi:hypothetical protein
MDICPLTSAFPVMNDRPANTKIASASRITGLMTTVGDRRHSLIPVPATNSAAGPAAVTTPSTADR